MAGEIALFRGGTQLAVLKVFAGTSDAVLKETIATACGIPPSQPFVLREHDGKSICPVTASMRGQFDVDVMTKGPELASESEVLIRTLREGFQQQREGFQQLQDSQREGFRQLREGFTQLREGFQQLQDSQREGFQQMHADNQTLSGLMAEVREKVVNSPPRSNSSGMSIG